MSAPNPTEPVARAHGRPPQARLGPEPDRRHPWRPRPLIELTRTRVLEFLREPEAIFWVFFFPVLLAVALGIAFRDQAAQPVPVAVEAGTAAQARIEALEASQRVDAVVLTPERARADLRTGRLALVVLDTDPPTYWFDPTRAESRLARLEVDEALQRAAGRADAIEAAELEMTERGSRYIDFLVPGLLGMTLMSTGLWAIGFTIVTQRAGKLLKLFIASPARRWQLLGSHVLARLVFMALEVAVLVVVAIVLLDVPMRGSLAAFALVSTLGSIAFVGLGLLVAARPRTVEGVSGLINLVMFPMWILSGVFFSKERFPDAAQPFIDALPLTALVDALRAIMLDGTPLLSLLPELANLTLWGAASFLVALKIFRWQ